MSVDAALPARIVPTQLFVLVLPAIEAYTRNQFQHLKSAHDREDAEAEVVGLGLGTVRCRSHCLWRGRG